MNEEKDPRVRCEERWGDTLGESFALRREEKVPCVVGFETVKQSGEV